MTYSTVGETAEKPVEECILGAQMARAITRQRAMQSPETDRFVVLLKEILVKKGISQRELSRRLGIKIGTLTRYLKGDVNPYDVKLGIQRALTEELGVTMDTLYANWTALMLRLTCQSRTLAVGYALLLRLRTWRRCFSHSKKLSCATWKDSRLVPRPPGLDGSKLTTSEPRLSVVCKTISSRRSRKPKASTSEKLGHSSRSHLEIFMNDKEMSKMQEVAFGMDTWPPELLEEYVLKTWPERCQMQQAFQNWSGYGEFPNCATMPTYRGWSLERQAYRNGRRRPELMYDR